MAAARGSCRESAGRHSAKTSHERVHQEPDFGWLSSVLSGHPSTLNLETNVHWCEPGVRAFVELEPNDHPLAVEQREGITVERVMELAADIAHPG